MVIGKNSVWKMLALFLVVLLAVLNIIFCKTSALSVVNALLVSAELLAAAVILYMRWSARS